MYKVVFIILLIVLAQKLSYKKQKNVRFSDVVRVRYI